MTELTDEPTSPGQSRWWLPHASTADEQGVVGVGADMAPATMVAAYRAGIFPWPHEDTPLPWFSPDPRAVFPLDGIHVSRSLRRTLRSCGWTTTIDLDMAGVIAGCRDRPREGTWITDEFARAYDRLAALGWAHSLEVWDAGRLVGGVMGILVGGVLTAESMFHRASDASKVALVDMADRLSVAGATLLDAQLMTDHLDRMGARNWPRSRFLALLAQVGDDPVRLPTTRLAVARLVEPMGSDAS